MEKGSKVAEGIAIQFRLPKVVMMPHIYCIITKIGIKGRGYRIHHT